MQESSRDLWTTGAVLALVPGLLLVDAGLAFARGWDPVSRLNMAVIFLALAALGIVALVMASRGGRRFLRERGGQLTHLVFSLVGAWIAAELIVGVYGWLDPSVARATPKPEEHTRPPSAQWIFTPTALTGIEGASRYTTNSFGVRGPEFPPRDSAYRILFIGGSTTECIYLDDEETWTHLVMQRLNQESKAEKVWTGAIGISGFPTVNHLKFLKASKLVDEVDSIVFLIGANDFNLWVKGFLNGHNYRWKGNLKEEVEGRPLWHYSPILNTVRTLWHRARSEGEDLKGENVKARKMQRHRGRLITSLSRDLDNALKHYEERIRWIVEEARRRGVRPVFITQPTLWDSDLSEGAEELLWMGAISDDGEYLAVETGREGIDRHNQVLMSVCQEMNLECISTESMNGEERFYYDGFHYNEEGARWLADLVATHFIDHAGPNGWDPAR